MNTFRLILFLTIILGLIIIAQSAQKNSLKQESKNASENNTSTANAKPADQTVKTNDSSPTPTQFDSIGTTRSESVSSQDALMYPNATQSGPKSYESQDDPNIITDWYKEKIVSLNMTTKTFVKTRSNDTILNKLVGSGKNGNVTIEISKEVDENTVRITISKS